MKKSEAVYTLLRRVVWLRDGMRCVVCGRSLRFDEFHNHHVLHRQYKHMLFDQDNCVCLCPTCHALDDTGELVHILQDIMGERFSELMQRAQPVVKVDLDEVRARLEAELAKYEHDVIGRRA